MLSSGDKGSGEEQIALLVVGGVWGEEEGGGGGCVQFVLWDGHWNSARERGQLERG